MSGGRPEGANADAPIKIANVTATEDPAVQQAVVDAAARGDLSIPIARTLKLADGAEAHALLTGGKVRCELLMNSKACSRGLLAFVLK